MDLSSQLQQPINNVYQVTGVTNWNGLANELALLETGCDSSYSQDTVNDCNSPDFGPNKGQATYARLTKAYYFSGKSGLKLIDSKRNPRIKDGYDGAQWFVDVRIHVPGGAITLVNVYISTRQQEFVTEFCGDSTVFQFSDRPNT